MGTWPGRPCYVPRAFTLIEVMISIALVLILVLGINAVFKMAADTVGTGRALSAKTRDGRAAQEVFNQDLAHLVQESDQPFFIIDSRTQLAFRNAADQQSDLDGIPATIDLNGNNIEGEAGVPGEKVNLAAASLRNHRVDTLSFFVRNLYARQTGNSIGPNQAYVDDMSSNEAWVTYGHLRVYDPNTGAPNANASYKRLGDGGYLDNKVQAEAPPLTAQTNPKSFYADDWVLGRMVMLLVRPTPPTGSLPGTYPNTIYDRNNVPQDFWWRQQTDTGTTNARELNPLSVMTQALSGGGIFLSDARYDLIGTTIGDFEGLLSTYITHTKYNTGGVPSGGQWLPDDWWTALPSDPGSVIGRGRFCCNPYPSAPLDPLKSAHTAPILLSNCTQFMVEFAGDYVTQNDVTTTSPPTSVVTAVAPDGVIDHYYDPTTGIRHIRWYGFPRDLDGDGHIIGYKAGRTNDQLVDVVPVRDVALTCTLGTPYYATPPNPLAFERHMVPTDLPLSLPAVPDYAAFGAVAAGSYYTAAWGPNDVNRPKMIRIIATVDDPNGRLSDGQTFEYVINLP